MKKNGATYHFGPDRPAWNNNALTVITTRLRAAFVGDRLPIRSEKSKAIAQEALRKYGVMVEAVTRYDQVRGRVEFRLALEHTNEKFYFQFQLPHTRARRQREQVPKPIKSRRLYFWQQV
ncbi:MAG TPA: hypothetical protein VEA59_02855 [Patescibacteria group bacterium]|nr:hypothetical protein [Patescibacteria group bacterium]